MIRRTIFAVLFCLSLGGCLSAPQEQTQRSATGGDKTGSTPATQVISNGQTYNYFFSQPPSTQPAATLNGNRITFTQTVTGTTADNKAGTQGTTSSGAQTGGAQTSSPSNTVAPQTPITVNTPGSASVGGLAIPGK